MAAVGGKVKTDFGQRQAETTAYLADYRER